jgi:hypothetical protein
MTHFCFRFHRTHMISVTTVQFHSYLQILMVNLSSDSGIAPMFVAAVYSGVHGVSVSENTCNKELILHTILRALSGGGTVSGVDFCLITCPHAQCSSASAVRHLSSQCQLNIPVVTICIYFFFCCCI